jgi:nucleotide-binding universal stress UspA family protein
MALRTLLLHADTDDRFAHRLSLAIAIARQHEARLVVLYALKTPIAVGLYAEPMGSPAVDLIQQEIDAERARAEELRQSIATMIGAEGLAWDWRSRSAPPGDSIAAQALTADLVIMGQEREASTTGPVADVALSSGRPVLCIPHVGNFAAPFRRILVAWRGTRESSRALHDAMPFLAGAAQVTLFCASEELEQDASADDAVRHLADHRIRAELRRVTLGDIDSGTTILNAVADNSADLLVMGAYGHGRMREFVFGGATRTILASMTVPTLLSH